MRSTSLLSAFLLTVVFLSSCKKEQDKIDPADANALQNVLVIPGGDLVSGNPPSPTGPGSPVLSSNQSTVTTAPGGQAQVAFNFSSSAGYNNCYVQVRGATNGYFNITGNNTSNNGAITIPINIPDKVGSGQFCVQYCISDAQGRISNIMETCITLEDNGSVSSGNGSFTISGQKYSGLCISTPSIFGSGIDVSIITDAGESFIIYNMPTQSSGSYQFNDGYDEEGTFGLVSTSNVFMGSRAGGSITKNGSNKFSFSCTMYDLSTEESLSASGNGSY